VSNQFSQTVGVIDVASNTQIDAIATTGDPFALEISPITSSVRHDKHQCAVENRLATKTVVASIPLIATSHHIRMDPRGRFLYVATRDGGTVMEVNWRTMAVERTLTPSAGARRTWRFHERRDLYVANELSNVLHVVSVASGGIALTSRSPAVGRAGALGDGGKLLYVGLVFNGGVQIINRETRATERILPVGRPRQIELDVSGANIIVTNEAGWADLIEPSDRSCRRLRHRHRHPRRRLTAATAPDTGFKRVSVAGGPIGIAAFGNTALVAQLQTASIARWTSRRTPW
jgi:YVTN family beta-propeller protein